MASPGAVDEQAGDLAGAVDAGDAATVAAVLAANPERAAECGDDGVSLLLHATYRGHHEVLQLLLEAGPLLDVFDAAALGRTAELDALLQRDPDQATAWSADGFTALGLACFFGRAETARRLLDAGADLAVPSRNSMRVTPLHSAAARSNADLVALLLEAGADPAVRQQGGWTPLHSAAHNGDAQTVGLLLAAGADPSAVNDGGLRPADLAATAGHTDLVRRLS